MEIDEGNKAVVHHDFNGFGVKLLTGNLGNFAGNVLGKFEETGVDDGNEDSGVTEEGGLEVTVDGQLKSMQDPADVPDVPS